MLAKEVYNKVNSVSGAGLFDFLRVYLHSRYLHRAYVRQAGMITCAATVEFIYPVKPSSNTSTAHASVLLPLNLKCACERV